MDITQEIGLITGILAIIGSVASYILFQGRMKWEVEHAASERKRLWERYEIIAKEVDTLEQVTLKTPPEIDKRLSSVEEQITNVRLVLESMTGEFRILSRFMEKKWGANVSG